MLGALRRDGWNIISIQGSHHQLRHPGKPGKVSVPVHGNRDLDIYVVRSILRQAGITTDELKELL